MVQQPDQRPDQLSGFRVELQDAVGIVAAHVQVVVGPHGDAGEDAVSAAGPDFRSGRRIEAMQGVKPIHPGGTAQHVEPVVWPERQAAGAQAGAVDQCAEESARPAVVAQDGVGPPIGNKKVAIGSEGKRPPRRFGSPARSTA